MLKSEKEGKHLTKLKISLTMFNIFLVKKSHKRQKQTRCLSVAIHSLIFNAYLYFFKLTAGHLIFLKMNEQDIWDYFQWSNATVLYYGVFLIVYQKTMQPYCTEE